MRTEGSLKEEACRRGFLNAATIKPAHINHNTNCPVIEIPKNATIEFDSGNITFKVGKYNDNFKQADSSFKWVGMIYDHKNDRWADIVTTRKTDFRGRYLKVIDDKCIQHYGVKNGDYLLYSHTDELQHEHWGNPPKNYYYGFEAHKKNYFELMPEGWTPKGYQVGETIWKTKTIGNVLSVFPSEGVCWQPTKELRDFLLARDKSSTTACGFHVKGIAWNYNSCWEVATYSGKPEYNIKQLEPFIQQAMVRQTPPKAIPDHLLTRPLTPDECYQLPEKWFIMTTKENQSALKDFLIAHKSEYKGYSNGWIPYVGNCLLYPQHSERCYGTYGPPAIVDGYKEITFEQFKKHVLTHTEKNQFTNNLNLQEDGKSRESRESSEKGESCKVQRPHLSIRGGSEIRATSIECSKVKIQVRDGYSADSL